MAAAWRRSWLLTWRRRRWECRNGGLRASEDRPRWRVLASWPPRANGAAAPSPAAAQHPHAFRALLACGQAALEAGGDATRAPPAALALELEGELEPPPFDEFVARWVLQRVGAWVREGQRGNRRLRELRRCLS